MSLFTARFGVVCLSNFEMLKEIDGFPSLPDGCQSDWLKCALKAIDRVQEAIE